MATPFESFVNLELPKRIATNISPTAPTAGQVPVFTGVGLLTENKAPSELGLVTPSDLTAAISTALSSVYTFQTLYNPSITSQYPTSSDTIGSVPIKKGFLWIISGITGQQTIGTKTVNNGDTVMALVDGAGAANDADWHITESNLGYTPENSENKVQNLSTPSAIAYPSINAVIAGLATKENTLANVISAGTYGNSTQYAIPTFNAKGICTGVTLQTVPVPVFTEANFEVQEVGVPANKITWSLSQLTAARVHTHPDSDIDFNNAVNVVTATNLNVIAGTNNKLLLCQNVTIDGLNNLAINCKNISISSSQKEAVFNNVKTSNVITGLLFPKGSTVEGTNAIRNCIKVLSAFLSVKPANQNIVVSDSDGVQPYFNFNVGSSNQSAVHYVTISTWLGQVYKKYRVFARVGFGLSVNQEDSSGDNIQLNAAFVESGDRLQTTLSVGSAYNSNSYPFHVVVESFYFAPTTT